MPALIALFTCIIVTKYTKESRDPNAQGLDWLGVISFTLALAVFTYAIIFSSEKGLSHPSVLSIFFSALVIFCIFIVVEYRQSKPMLDLRLFGNLHFIGVQLLAIAPAYAYIVLLIILPARFIGAEGYSPLEAGQIMVALSAPLLFIPFIAGLLTRWFSVGVICSIGLVITAVGLFWLSYSIAGTLSAILLPLVVIGVGIGLPWGLMDGLAVSVVEKERAGMAVGIFNAVRLAGDGIAIAVAGVLLTTYITTNLSTADIPKELLTELSMRLAISDFTNALKIAPSIDPALLHKGYDKAFSTLFNLLAIATISTALLLFILLGRVNTKK